MSALTSHGSDGTESHPGLLNEDINVRFPGVLELSPGAVPKYAQGRIHYIPELAQV